MGFENIGKMLADEGEEFGYCRLVNPSTTRASQSLRCATCLRIPCMSLRAHFQESFAALRERRMLNV